MQELSPKLETLLNLITESGQNQVPVPNEVFEAIGNNLDYSVELLNWLSYEEHLIEVSNEKLTSILQCIEFSLNQLKASSDHHMRGAQNTFNALNEALSNIILNNPNLNLVRALFNIFIDSGLPISEDIKEDYLHLVSDRMSDLEESENALEIKDIEEDSDISAFEIAHALFVESSALPRDYILAFLQDLIDVGSVKSLNTAILFLLHPLASAREMVLEDFSSLLAKKPLSAISLSRLIKINHWLNHPSLKHLIELNQQRGVLLPEAKSPEIQVYATEIDCTGAQALFFVLKRHNRFFQSAGLVIKKAIGLKDAWVSDGVSKKEAMEPIVHSQEQGLSLRKVDLEYANSLINHILSQAVAKNNIPDIHVLELSEELNQTWKPIPIDFKKAITELAKNTSNLDDATWQKKSLIRSKSWPQTKENYASWFLESLDVDRVVNQNSTFKNGIKFCDVEKTAINIVDEVFEKSREDWIEHFYCLAYWSSISARKNELFWQDSLYIAKLLLHGAPMKDIPLLDKIAKESIVHSLETMEQRKSHLS